MKRNIIISIFSVIFILTFTQCEDEILNKVPHDLYSEANIFSDINLTEQLALHTYNSTANWGINVQDWWGRRMGIENATDECWHHWTPTIYRIDLGIITPDDMGIFKNMWRQKYQYVREANIFLNKIDDSPVAKTDPEKVKVLKGEIKYLRASLYCDLIDYWGGVPIFDKPFELTDDFKVSRNSYKECVEFIVKDLDEASNLVPVSRPAQEFGRVTKGACLALKSRILLHAASKLHNPATLPNGPLYDYDKPNKWQEAADAAKAVFDLNKYALVQVKGWKDYQLMFLAPNSEIIFARPYNPNYGNVPGDLTTVPDKSHGTSGYNGWAASIPTQNIVWDFKMANGKNIGDPGSGYDENNPYVNRDPRFYANIVFNGTQFRGRDAQYYLPGGKDSKEGPNNIHYALTGYNLRKFMDESIDFDKQVSPKRPFIIIRLAEIYLNYAEAQFNLGNEAAAREYLNKVANRVGMPDINSTGENLLKDIKNERQIELCFEGRRFFDLRRWMDEKELGEAVMGIKWDKLDANGNLSPSGSLKSSFLKVQERKFNTKNYYLPIPQSEIDKAELEQNFEY